MAGDYLLPYPQMILEAIDALKVAGGADKSSISEYVESKYEEIPTDHDDLLTAHLTKMKDSGELLLVNNNYLKSLPNNDLASAAAVAPPKRGRGRPPKPKDPSASEPAAAPLGAPRPRGRPPSKVDPNAPPAAKKPKPSGEPSGRPRGRPRKVKPVENGVEA